MEGMTCGKLCSYAALDLTHLYSGFLSLSLKLSLGRGRGQRTLRPGSHYFSLRGPDAPLQLPLSGAVW